MADGALRTDGTSGGSAPGVVKCYEGGCHCGRVRFEVKTDKTVAIDCNCSICTKKGYLHFIVPPEHFKLLGGELALSTYTWNTGVAKHHFCQTCGIAPFYRPRSHPDCYDVNVRCLDADGTSGGSAPGAVRRDARKDFTVEPFDGAHWEENVGKIR
jgi:hypothetical protein